jgi:hypothetical protein
MNALRGLGICDRGVAARLNGKPDFTLAEPPSAAH